MKKIISIVTIAFVCASSLCAQEAKPTVKLYGFVRNFASIDTRACKAGTEDLFTHLPKDENWNADKSADLNKVTTYRFLALTSRLGVDAAYEYDGYKFTSKIEADFYNKNSGTAIFRLRQAYMTVNKGNVTMKMGQAWHPMAADMVDVFSLNTGAPFAPFSRTPVLLFDVKATDNLVATIGTIYQMQYLSSGPSGASEEYIKHGGSEFYCGLSYVAKKFTAKVGVDMLTISPRWQDNVITYSDVAGLLVPSGTTVAPVNDKITTVSPFVFAKYNGGDFSIQSKVVLHQAGEHMSLMGGYALLSTEDQYDYTYTPTLGLTANVSAVYKIRKGLKAVLFGGFYKNLGLVEDIDYANLASFYFNGNGAKNLTQAFRVTPEIIYSIGKFDLGIEYECTGATFGDFKVDTKTNGLATENARTVVNNRLQVMTKFTF